MIKNIVFDMGNVLIDFRWEALFHEMGLEGERFARMAEATAEMEPSWASSAAELCLESAKAWRTESFTIRS